MKILTAVPKLLSALLLLGVVACQKTPLTEINQGQAKKLVLDYMLHAESMYMMKYRMQYNEHYQIIAIYRGEEFATDQQMQLLGKAIYSLPQQEIPDSVVWYNTKGYEAGSSSAADLVSIPGYTNQQNYIWPQRFNAFFDVKGSRFMMALTNQKVAWAGQGHLGSESEIQVFSYLKMINRSTLADSIQIAVRYKSDGTDRKFNDYKITYNDLGLPSAVYYVDKLNPLSPRLKFSYNYQ